MFSINQIKLLVVSFFVFALAGLLFWQGIYPELSNFKNKQINTLQIEASQSSGQLEALNSSKFPEEGKVVKVIDGDTIEVQYINGGIKKVRLIGIDTPETVDPRKEVQCFGREASNETKRLIENKTVFLEKDISETDKFSRLLRYIYMKIDNSSDYLFINDYLIRQGFAHASTFPPDVKFSTRFSEAEREARENDRGLWSVCR